MIRLQQAVNDMKFLSTLSLRRATGGYGCAYLYLIISIHALLAESDGMTEFIGALFDISIHALLAESDLPVFLSGFWAYLFLSTLSLRRATHCIWILCRQHPDFYPRSPCGERRCRKRRQWFHHGNFYPRSPCGERHQGQKVQDQEGHISIHALLAESDICIASGISVSTLSLRRATITDGSICLDSKISIHALLAESDLRVLPFSAVGRYFYPRSPCGERPACFGRL